MLGEIRGVPGISNGTGVAVPNWLGGDQLIAAEVRGLDEAMKVNSQGSTWKLWNRRDTCARHVAACADRHSPHRQFFFSLLSPDSGGKCSRGRCIVVEKYISWDRTIGVIGNSTSSTIINLYVNHTRFLYVICVLPAVDHIWSFREFQPVCSQDEHTDHFT